MANKKYNGWANYETWLYNLHHENYDLVESFVDHHIDYDNLTIDQEDYEKAIKSFADQLENDAYDQLPAQSCFMSDMTNTFLSEVNWYESAKIEIDQFLSDGKVTII